LFDVVDGDAEREYLQGQPAQATSYGQTLDSIEFRRQGIGPCIAKIETARDSLGQALADGE
jgi:hypothetical protein